MKSAATRDKVISEGLQRLSEGGFASVTIGRLAEATNLSKSGLFAHFQSREALEIALLDAARDMAHKHVVEPALRNPEGLPRLMALVGLWFGWSARAGLRGGCPIAAGLFELDDVPGVVRDCVSSADQEWRALLRTAVQAAIDLGHLYPDADGDQIVWELCGIYLAHHVSMRFHRDPHAGRRARHALVAVLQRSGANPADLQAASA
ncbi:TetR/AcrR family transcriptional regulator [Sphingomonas gei]|uniref:TetR/AcrR family transcriptional regulator n=2 Tax=Sphingomonas gei TaxID=1395960 RepID=A0A4S1XDH8_9SPHN|nr:TetR/AcrR family transcriptional regulator [Sphingomonas gei]